MNLKYFTNYRTATGGDVLYQIKQFLVGTIGWSIVASGNGAASFSTSGSDFITSATVMQTAQAWWVLKTPTGTLQILTQVQGATHRIYRGKISPAAGFISAPLNSSGITTGSISATSSPSATDQIILNGTRDDTALNSGIQTCLTSDGTYTLHGFADLSSPYGFLFWCINNNVPKCNFAFMFDPILGGLSGDPDPWVAYLSGVGSNGNTVFGGSVGNNFVEETTVAATVPMGWIARGYANAISGRIPALFTLQAQNSNEIIPNSRLTIYGSEACSPVQYARRALLPGGGGYKGVSSLLKWKGTSGRMPMEVPSQGNVRDSVVLDDIITFWDGSTPQV